ncbi:hypothetical protein CXG81DRAFT_11607 [Caulochytrium protostelioides]|uniref:HIT domain-containing protein n=1 Tax=Caulochytrium protostelioides TaxID=1555241 RepID=A0A4V1IUU2_9FUNG|nr:hypothetical protein CXG81DRAFT_11607 [Caulochytrium protostelioides]|eukprot:RKP01749.1 hypothetical protein CXG81DRAFT_11607 [Caulochytrium protostelioides]
MAAAAATNANCIFCKIIKGAIPSMKLVETELSFAFLDIGPISRTGHLVIPKHHGEKLTDMPDEYLADVMPVAKKIATALGCADYNILQNNGRLAHQEVPHVHFHVIPKSEKDGLEIGWPVQKMEQDELKALHTKIMANL